MVIWRQAEHLDAAIERLRAMLSRYEMTKQVKRLAAEKQCLISAANSKLGPITSLWFGWQPSILQLWTTNLRQADLKTQVD